MQNGNKQSHSRSFVEKVRESIDLIQLVRKSVSLHRIDSTWYAGATSASSQSGASLRVNNKWYKNFATGDKGDALNWIAYDQQLDIKRDFPKILAIAAEEAGIPYEAMSKEDLEKVKTTRDVQDALTQAAEIYHSNLTSEIREFIHKKWGISDETIDNLLIGYAKPGNGANLYGVIPDEVLVKTGLINVVFNNGKDQMITEFFQGRIIFPYWYNGKVVNFAARESEKNKDGTIKNLLEQELLKTADAFSNAKYLKLLTHSEKRPYIADCVNNRYLYGEDTVRGKNYCVIAEGISDSIILIQNGYPVLSPITTNFTPKDYDTLFNVAKKFGIVYICNDNEENKSGEKGAIKTGKMLKNVGVEVRIVTLPKPEGINKIDTAEYFLTHTKEDFDGLLSTSEPLYTHLLNSIEKSENPKQNLENCKKFIDEVVKYLPKDEADTIINYDMQERFDFKRDDCRTLKSYYTRIKEESKDECKDQANDDTFKIPFDIVADRILQKINVFTFDDTKEIYVYKNGVYTKKGAEAQIKDMANEIYAEVFTEYCNSTGFELPEHIPVPSINFRNEVIEYVRIKTNTFRESVDNCTDYKHLINMQNGIYNLDTGELMPHDPKYRLVRQMPISYNKYADCPQVRKFLDDVVSAQEAEVLLEFLGYSFIPDIKHDQAIMLLGNGANGKSVWLKVIIAMQGLENICSTSLQRLCDDKFAMSELYGKLLNIFPDLSDSMIQGDDAFKGLSSGDLLTAQKKYGQPFQFMNYARQIYSANDLPAVRKGNYAYFRRWMLIKFPNTFVENPDANKKNEKKKDKDLLGKLTTAEELSGLFNLATACLKELQKKGEYSYAETVEEVAERYQMNSDPVRIFVEKYTEPSEEDTPKTELYEDYKKWCTWKKLTPLTTIKFAKRMKSLGFIESRPHDDISNKKVLSWVGVVTNENFVKNVPNDCSQTKLDEKFKVDEELFWQSFKPEGKPAENKIFSGFD